MLSSDAYRVLCGLVAPEGSIVTSEVRAEASVWDELDAAFPVSRYDLSEEQWEMVLELDEEDVEAFFGAEITRRRRGKVRAAAL